MPSGWRSRRSLQAIREDRLREVALLYIQGESQAAIATRYDKTQQQISKDIATIIRRWQAEALPQIDAYKVAQLAKLDALEREHWEQWQQSKRPRTVTTTRSINAPNGLTTEETTRYVEQTGNPTFLQQVLACIHERCAILGLFAPKQVDIRQSLETFARDHARRLGLPEDEAIDAVYAVLRSK